MTTSSLRNIMKRYTWLLGLLLCLSSQAQAQAQWFDLGYPQGLWFAGLFYAPNQMREIPFRFHKGQTYSIQAVSMDKMQFQVELVDTARGKTVLKKRTPGEPIVMQFKPSRTGSYTVRCRSLEPSSSQIIGVAFFVVGKGWRPSLDEVFRLQELIKKFTEAFEQAFKEDPEIPVFDFSLWIFTIPPHMDWDATLKLPAGDYSVIVESHTRDIDLDLTVRQSGRTLASDKSEKTVVSCSFTTWGGAIQFAIATNNANQRCFVVMVVVNHGFIDDTDL